MVKKSTHIPLFIKKFLLLITVVFFLIIPEYKAYAIELDEESIRALIKETQALRQETKDLRNEVTQLKKQLGNNTIVTKPTRTKKPSSKNSKTENTIVKSEKNKPTTKSATSKTPKKDKQLNLGGIPLLVAPDLGTTPAYNGSDLLTNLSQTNGDLLALQYRQTIENRGTDTEKAPDYYVILSGSLGAQYNTGDPYIGNAISDVDLTAANITMLAGVGKWITGFMSLDFDGTPPEDLNPPQIGPRYLNSRIYVDQGYITLGNLNQSDIYASIGQMYLPFGQFNGFMVNSPLTASMFTTIDRPVLLGFSHSNDTTEFDVEVFAYQGDTVRNINSSAINAWGANADYIISKTRWNADLGMGYISNIADAEGFQLNGQNAIACTVFGGFAFPCNQGNVLIHPVPGFDIHGSLTLGSLSFISEYITSTRRFDRIDLAYNHKGARVEAFDFETGYEFKLFNKPSSIAVGYGYTKEALALLLPARQYSITLTTSFWRNTTQSLGFQHDVNYGRYDEASGQSLPVYFSIDRPNLGKTSNTAILAMNVSF